MTGQVTDGAAVHKPTVRLDGLHYVTSCDCGQRAHFTSQDAARQAAIAHEREQRDTATASRLDDRPVDAIIASLLDAHQQVVDAETEVDRLRRERNELIATLYADGVAVARMAEAIGATRRGVHKMMKGR